jgi:hypothetical protein
LSKQDWKLVDLALPDANSASIKSSTFDHLGRGIVVMIVLILYFLQYFVESLKSDKCFLQIGCFIFKRPKKRGQILFLQKKKKKYNGCKPKVRFLFF